MAKRLKVSRKEILNEPDQFLTGSEKALLFFMKNRGSTIGSIAGIIMVGLSITGFNYYQETQTLKNEAFYFQMEKIVADSKGPTTDVRSVWEKIGDGYQKERATLLLADNHFQKQEYDIAEGLYSSVMDNSTPEQINYQMAQVGLGFIYEANKNYKKAIEEFKTVISANTGFPLFEVYWSLSRCHELNNDVSNALLVLREMQIKFAENPEVEKIEHRIKQLSA